MTPDPPVRELSVRERSVRELSVQELSVRELIVAPHPDRAPLPETPASARVLRGVPYAEVPGGRPLELDLWLPMTPSPAPLVLFLHGGAWRRGRRDDMGFRTRGWSPGPFARIAAAGFAVACADYRLSGEATFPAPLHDLHAALRWLTLRGAELGVDTGRTVVWGESAGGHLASLLALTAPGLAGAVVWYGPSDLTSARGPFTPQNPATPEALLLGGPPATTPDRAREASPLSRVHPLAPPFLLIHGEADTMVDCSHSTSLAAALRDTSASPVDLWTVPGAGHGWHGAPDATVEAVFDRSLTFARNCARGEG
ncbi:alpha/beta hydrolase fold domain-containing protein [Streptomyces sp. NPDC087440]|uniref:alpha/beta hydrolase fold domain-containing protein n=1 Tax=Streptomyces sp. NPDC087440 TaxID=3365790 RepID=UPI0037F1B946